MDHKIVSYDSPRTTAPVVVSPTGPRLHRRLPDPRSSHQGVFSLCVAVGRWSSLQSRSPRGCKRIDGGRGEQAGGASRGHNAQAATRVPISTKYVTVLAIGAPSSFGGPRLSSGLLLLFCGTLTVLGCRHKHSTVHDCDPMACSDGSTRDSEESTSTGSAIAIQREVVPVSGR